MAGPVGPRSSSRDRFDSLFEAYFADVWGYARRRCTSSADADDVAAETFAVAWRRRDAVPGGQERIWLFGVARRVLANQRRSAGRRDLLEIRLIHYKPHADTSLTVDPEQSESREIWEALALLPIDDREILMLRAWDELAVTEIAVMFQCSANAVSLRLHRARARLREHLATDDENPGHITGDPELKGETK